MGAKFLTRDAQRDISKILPQLNNNFDKKEKIKLDTLKFSKKIKRFLKNKNKNIKHLLKFGNIFLSKWNLQN